MPLDRRDIDAALTKKGFRKSTESDHDRYFLFTGDVKEAISTKISRGSGYKQYNDDLLSKVARQLQLNKGQLVELVSCSIDGDAYRAILTANGVRLAKVP